MGQADDGMLTTKLVDRLAAANNGHKSRALATEFGCELTELRAVLTELERIGAVYRTGQTRGTRWWLG